MSTTERYFRNLATVASYASIGVAILLTVGCMDLDAAKVDVATGEVVGFFDLLAVAGAAWLMTKNKEQEEYEEATHESN
jgi:hypothetical protein